MTTGEDSTPVFEGTILESAHDFRTPILDIQGPHHVFYPVSKADVSAAMQLTQNRRRHYRSGRQVAKQDTQDGTGGVVIDLSNLSGITVKGQVVKAEAAATSAALAEALAERGLALPVSDSSGKSIASSVRGERESRLSRTLGSWSKHITAIRAVKPDGRNSTFKPKAKSKHKPALSALDQVRAEDAIIVELTFKAKRAKALWMLRSTFPFPDAGIAKLAEALFLSPKLPKGVDLALDTFLGSYGVPLVTITAVGPGSAKKRELLREIVEAALQTLPKQLGPHIDSEELEGAAVLDSVAEARFGVYSDETIEADRDGDTEVERKAWRGFVARVAQDITAQLSRAPESGVHLASRLFVNTHEALEVVHHETRPRRPSARAAISMSKRMAMPRPETALALTASSGPIPGFEGDVYERKDRGYRAHAKQYATSSYPRAKMRPFMVAYPRHVADIVTAITFAKSADKRIVARSGGHQYTGKSSGGADTIVLSMDAFDRVDYHDGLLELGPAARLNTLAKGNAEHGVTIPHGECPKVAIGGHAQTGGYGHLVRGFGLALDYLLAFEIVLANGTVLTVRRPDPDAPAKTNKQKLERELYWGVLGGNAGSFGIVTNYTFELIEDRQHKKSYRYDAVRKYRKSTYTKLMRQVQTWTQKVAKGTLSGNVDFMMTVESRGRMPFFPVMLIELVHKNKTSDEAPGMKDINEVIAVARSGMSWWERRREKDGLLPPSQISNSFVRRWPMTTRDGREFPHPYKKRINCTMEPLSDDFLKHFVNLVDEVVTKSTGVKLVFQMLFGGGAYAAKGRSTTSIPHRDYVYCFVFDLFYKRGHEQDALDFQARMQEVVDTYFTPKQELRVFWGTFGTPAQTNMKARKVQKMFYDSPESYARLQKLKLDVDRDDVFHTSLTVQLP